MRPVWISAFGSVVVPTVPKGRRCVGAIQSLIHLADGGVFFVLCARILYLKVASNTAKCHII